MDYGSKLPFTGTGIVLGGLVISQAWLLIAGLSLFAVGIACVRLGWRRDKGVEAP